MKLSEEFAQKMIPRDNIEQLVNRAGLRVLDNVSYSVSHPDDKTAFVTLIIPVQEEVPDKDRR